MRVVLTEILVHEFEVPDNWNGSERQLQKMRERGEGFQIHKGGSVAYPDRMKGLTQKNV